MSNGTIRQRSAGSFELRYQINGRTATETVRTSSKRVAQQRLRELLSAVDHGAKAAPSRDTCAAWFDQWLQSLDADLSPMTAQLYRRKVASHLKPMFGDIRLRHLDLTTIRSKFAALDLAASTKNTLRRILSASLTRAVEDGKLRHNPVLGWRDRNKASAHERPEQAVLSPDDANNLLETLRDGGSALFAPVLLALGLGARRGEIAALAWGRVNLNTGDVTIREALKELSASDIRTGVTKTGKARIVRLPASYAELLREWKRKQAEQLLLLGVRQTTDTPICAYPDGRRLSPNQMTDLFTTAAAKFGRVDIHFHSLRHTHASILLACGETIAAVQKRLGHGTPSTTLDVYTHFIPQDDDADRLDRMLRGSNL